MFDNCVTVNDYIEEIFRAGLKESHSKTIDGSEISGYYLGVKSCQNSKVKKLNQWQRLIINIKSKSKKVYGETDTENTFADCMLYAYEALLEILSGENENFPIEHDIKTLLEQRSNEICSYVIRVVEMKQKTYINSKKNPNYIVHQKGGKKEYERVNFYYLDNDTELNPYQVLEHEEIIPETGEMTEVILEALLASDLLTNLERAYLEVALSDESYISGGAVYDLDDNMIFNKDKACRYRKGIRNAIHTLIERGEVVEIKNDRLILLE